MENTEADGANGILKNAIIAVPLKYISNFWRLLEMPLINCKVELNLKQMNHCALSAAGANNDNANSKIILFFLSNTQNYITLLLLYQQKTTKSYENSLAKDLKEQFIGMNKKEKVGMKVRQMSIDIFSIQTL